MQERLRERARRGRPRRRRGHQLHAGRSAPRDDRDLSRGGRARRAAVAPHPGCRLQRARLERRIGGRGDRGGGRDGGAAAHRPHQQHGPGAGLRVPADDRGRARPRARRHDRGLSVRLGHDDAELRALQPGLARAHAHRLLRPAAGGDRRAALEGELRSAARRRAPRSACSCAAIPTSAWTRSSAIRS